MVFRFFSVLSLAASLLLATIAPVSLRAQPDLRILRVTTAWPRVEIDVAARCDGALLSGFDATDFTLTEDGAPVTDFTVDCPPHDQSCRTAVVLLFDVSGSMMGSSIAGAKLPSSGKRRMEPVRPWIASSRRWSATSYSAYLSRASPLTTGRPGLALAAASHE